MYSDEDIFHEEVDSDDDLHHLLGWRRNRFEQNKFRKFYSIQQKVTEGENELITPKDEERLFNKINFYLKKPFATLGIYTLRKLAYIRSTVSVDRLQEMATVICKNVLSPLSVGTEDYIVEYSDFCKAFAYLEARTSGGVVHTFENILISVFIYELSKKFNYVLKLERLLENRDIPLEKKRKWLDKQIEEQQKVFKVITKKSINFLDRLSLLYPEIVFRVIEFLLECEEEERCQYLQELLLTVRVMRKGSVEVSNPLEVSVTKMYDMKLNYWEKYRHHDFMRQLQAPLPVEKKNWAALFQHINFLANQNRRVTASMREIIETQMFRENPPRETSPEDYIKYSIELCLFKERSTAEDDFVIDQEDKYNPFIYTLRSKDLSGYNSPMHMWRGLKVKLLKVKPQVHLD